MRRFIKASSFFLLLLVSTIIVLITVVEFVINKNADYRLNTKPKYIVLGHSHSECAFNDSIIDNFKNISHSGESYFYTYLKTIKIIEQNPSIDVVFIEFTNNQINKSMNNWIWDDSHIKYRYSIYSPIMQFSDKIILATNNFDGFFNSNSISLKENLTRLFTRNYNYSNDIGNYLYLNKEKTDSLIKQSKTIKTQEFENSISELNLKYLSKTIAFCKQKGKKVILIRSPLHALYTGYNNEIKYKDILSKKFSNCDYLDFSKFTLNNSEFADLEHLNYKGAIIFSKWFNGLLENGFLEKPNPNLHIEQEIKKKTF